MLLAVLLAILALAGWFLVPFAWRKIEERRLARLCRDHRTIVLSYDDGPGIMRPFGLVSVGQRTRRASSPGQNLRAGVADGLHFRANGMKRVDASGSKV